jgi:uncharacterized protein involved in outer membrane biogenesis
MTLPKPVRWILWGIAGLISIILILVTVLALVRIPIDLTAHKGVLEKIASDVIGRQVTIDSNIKVTTSLRPIFTIGGLRLSNPAGFTSGDYARMQRARLQIRTLPLLAKKVHVEDFSVAGLALFLEENEAGAVNWIFSEPVPSTEENLTTPTPQKLLTSITSDTLVVKKIDLRDISVSFRKAESSDPLEFKIDVCTGSALVGKPFHLDLKGALLNEPFATSINVASLDEFLEHNRSWTEIETDIANARLKLTGNINLATASRSLRLSVAVEGKQLERFNQMLRLDLPPVPSYRARSTLTLIKDRLELTDVELYVSDSKLHGRLTAVATDERPKVVIDLRSPLIQINDFVFPDWSPRTNIADTTQQPKTIDESEEKIGQRIDTTSTQSIAKLLAPESLKRLNARLQISAKQVLSGEDQLGSGHLAIELKEGRITVDPLELNLPGGSLRYAVSIKPDPKKSNAWIRAKIENFDFGVLVHRTDPTSNMGGTLDLDVELKTEAATLNDIMANGNGHFDFSAHPKNFRAGILDLWAVNLLVTVVARSDKDQSQIECLIGRWSMKDGYLKPDAFVVDTSRMRICGTGWVDFKKEEVNLRVAPVPKKPAFFSLATPIGVKGKFSDFKLGIVPGGLLGTSVRFITSPIHVPIARLAGISLPKDGSDVCGMPLGPNDRPSKPPAGCSRFYK